MTALRNGVDRYVTAVRRSPTQMLAFVMAVWFTSNGPFALIIFPDFSLHPMHCRTIEVLGFLRVTVNGWHALFHLFTGLIGLLLVRTRAGAIAWAFFIAVLYITVAFLGLAAGGNNVFGMLAVDTFGSWVHFIEGFSMLVLGVLAQRSNRTDRRAAVA